ncbi:hypothetical protein P9112_006628 [Eukaryota sp. TZLM1-RC]
MFSFIHLAHALLADADAEASFLSQVPDILSQYFDNKFVPSPPPSPITVSSSEEADCITSSQSDIEVIHEPPPPSTQSQNFCLIPQTPFYHTLGHYDVQHLNPTFPTNNLPYYEPSELQRAILDHMKGVRTSLNSSIGCLVLATALGKTILSIIDLENDLLASDATNDEIYPKLKFSCTDSTPQPRRYCFRCLFLVHSSVILSTAFAKFKQHFQGKFNFSDRCFLQISSDSSSINQRFDDSIFIFSLFQSFENQFPVSLVSTITHLVIDEVHHSIAPTYYEILSNIRKSTKLRYQLGLTATLTHRNDPEGSILKKIFNNVVYAELTWISAKNLNLFPEVEYLEVLPTTFPSRLAYSSIISQVTSFDRSRTSTEVILDVVLRKLSHSLKQLSMSTSNSINQIVNPVYISNVVSWFEEFQRFKGFVLREKVIIFCRDIKTADETAAELAKLNKKAVSLHSKTNQSVSQIISAFKSGVFNYLVTVGMVLEGFDLPAVDCILIARMTRSEIVFTQMIGRVLRKCSELNDSVTIIDVTLALRRRWERLRDDVTDNSLIDQMIGFWKVHSFSLGSFVKLEEEECIVID